MLTFIYPISYLLCLSGLLLWFYFRDDASRSRKMSSLFLFSFLIYLVSLAFSEATVSYKLLILFRDMLILGAVSQIFNYVRKNSLLVLLAAIVVYGFIQFVGFNMLFDTFPQVKQTQTAADDTYELLIETKNGQVPKAYEQIIRKYGLTVQQAFHPNDLAASELDEFLVAGIPDANEKDAKKIIRELTEAEGTDYIEYNEVITLEVREGKTTTQEVKAKFVNDPYVKQQWGWDLVQGDRVHELIRNSGLHPQKKALIAIVDSGVDGNHPDLASQFRASGANDDTDPLGHGTHCAGIAAAISNNGIGIASLIPSNEFVQVVSVKVMNSMGIGSQQQTIAGIIKAADMGADVISMSLGGISSDTRQKAYEEAVKYANAKGAIVVAAAGNNNQNAKGYAPANAKGVITVSAIGSDSRKAPFSNTVSDLQFGVAAPGVKIMSTYPNQQYKELDGTSMATPMVSGLIGLLKSFRPNLTTAEAYKILFETGKKYPDDKAGGRLIQAADALEKVLD